MSTGFMKNRSGMTLLEVMISVSILGIVTGTLYTLAASLGQAAHLQEAKATTLDDARNAMMALTRELHQASNISFSSVALPGSILQYRVADDIDGNGTAVNGSAVLELSALRTVGVDTDDVNGDGETTSQLIITDGTNVRVIANGLAPNEDANADGLLDVGEDQNGNGRVNRGIWFERNGLGLVITIETQRRVGPDGPFVISRLQETIYARN